MRTLRVLPIAKCDLDYWKQTDSKKAQRIKTIVAQLCINPMVAIGKPEPLKHDKAGLWSCRIDRHHRLIYSFDEEYVYLWRAHYHYVDIPEWSAKNTAAEMGNGDEVNSKDENQ